MNEDNKQNYFSGRILLRRSEQTVFNVLKSLLSNYLKRVWSQRTQCTWFKSMTRAKTSIKKNKYTLLAIYLPTLWLKVRWTSVLLDCNVSSYAAGRYPSSIYTWAGRPQRLSGASICWISWRSCCFWECRRQASVGPTTSGGGCWAGGASGGRSAPLQYICSLKHKETKKPK